MCRYCRHWMGFYLDVFFPHYFLQWFLLPWRPLKQRSDPLGHLAVSFLKSAFIFVSQSASHLWYLIKRGFFFWFVFISFSTRTQNKKQTLLMNMKKQKSFVFIPAYSSRVCKRPVIMFGFTSEADELILDLTFV